MEPLSYDPIDHAHRFAYYDEALDRTVWGRSAVRYLRFRRPVQVARLELPLSTDVGRWVPTVPSHPAHLVVSTWDPDAGRFRLVLEVDLPEDPRIGGEGLAENTPMDEMEAHFAAASQAVHTINLDGDLAVATTCLRIECDREHLVWPSHGECNGGARNVPFGILAPIRALGDGAAEANGRPPARAERLALLTIEAMAPVAPTGMRVRNLPSMILFEGPRFSVGFSPRRPILMHLGWSAWPDAAPPSNRLRVRGKDMRWTRTTMGGLSGPLLRGIDIDEPSHLWGGTVTFDGPSVVYRVYPASRRVTITARFTVRPDGMDLEVEQECPEPSPVLEAEGWRFAWDLRRGMTAPAAIPTIERGRAGILNGPIRFSGEGVGCLEARPVGEEPTQSAVVSESYRSAEARTDGIVLADRVLAEGAEGTEQLILPQGRRTAGYRFDVVAFQPASADSAPGGDTAEAASTADERSISSVARHWGTVFACFRPELAGFSNHAASTNVHSNQWAPIEIAARTHRPEGGPDPIDLARFTIGQALLGGGGYGYHRELYLDSDPILVSMAALIHRQATDLRWLRHVEPGLLSAYRRIVAGIDDAGLLVCRALSGNTGSHRWSCNAMDVVGFGHLDAYVNAWGYRALRCLASLFATLGRSNLSEEAGRGADLLLSRYPSTFVNPQTGWVAGWRSRDGQLHDYAFVWVNAVAIAFGLLDDAAAHAALCGLERLRHDVGLGDGRLGLPSNLLPIDPDDQMGDAFARPGQPSFEFYTDGGLSGTAGYYLRALDRYGLSDVADTLAREILEGYDAGAFGGPMAGGQEFLTWDGIPTGYEGTLIVRCDTPWAAATQFGMIPRLDPEWWPA